MFARSATSERTAALSSRWTASASRESAPKTDPPSIADKVRIRSAFRLIGRLRASLKSRMKLDFEVLHHGCMRQSSGAVAISSRVQRIAMYAKHARAAIGLPPIDGHLRQGRSRDTIDQSTTA